MFWYGFGLLSRDRSTVYGIVCAILAVGLGLFTECKFFPFIKDDSFNYFVTHIHELTPVTLIMIALGGLLRLLVWNRSNNSTLAKMKQQLICDGAIR